MNTRALLRRYDSVQQDWRAFLPFEKAEFFSVHTRLLEDFYLAFSYALNEALNFRKLRDSSQASQEVTLAAESCARLAHQMSAVLQAMRQYAHHFGIVPNQAPLETANFQSEAGQRRARHNNLLSHILLTERSQFLYKLSTLEEIVDEQTEFFVKCAQALATGGSLKIPALWQALDSGHFDLNTCLRETDVCLKSFLFVLPEPQLNCFDLQIRKLAINRQVRPQAGGSSIRARRIATVAGE